MKFAPVLGESLAAAALDGSTPSVRALSTDDRSMDATTQKIIDDPAVAAEKHDAAQANRLDPRRVLEPDRAGCSGSSRRRCTPATSSRSAPRAVSPRCGWRSGPHHRGHVLTLDVDRAAQDAVRDSVAPPSFGEQVTFGGRGGAAPADGEGSVSTWPSSTPSGRVPGVVAAPDTGAPPRRPAVADNATSHPEEIAPLRR